MNDALDSAVPFILSFKKGYNNILPEYSWGISEDGRTITLTATSDFIVKAQVWTSENNRNRDWRLIRCASGPTCANPLAYWTPRDLDEIAPGVYTHTLQEPKAGHYSAFFLEIHYELQAGFHVMPVTTDVSIIPQSLPYAPCPPEVCDCQWNCAQ